MRLIILSQSLLASEAFSLTATKYLTWKSYKRVHNGETIAALNYEIQKISFYTTQMINPFLNSRISTNHY
jgi:hypothetical protein